MSTAPFLKFLSAPNLVEQTLEESYPWDYLVPDDQNSLKKIPKAQRRLALLKPTTKWNVYTAVAGCNKHARISKTNPAKYGLGFVVDYDMKSDPDTVLSYINQRPASQHPNFIEVSLGGKIRLVWVFAKPILFPSSDYALAFYKNLSDKMSCPTLLAGFDPSSLKPTEMWTNGGTWYNVKETPLSWDIVFGIACETNTRVSMFDKGEIALDVIYEEVKKRFPNRWEGEFKKDALGRRFWDETADNPTGCQIKPDGCLCFTGNEPFVKWDQILGKEWCEEQRVLNLGRAGEGIYFDGRSYWEKSGERWMSITRVDTILRLTGRGLSSTKQRGQMQSDAERVLDHIQQHNRIQGAAPLVNYPRGIVDLDGNLILNTADLMPVMPVKGPNFDTDPTKDFPFLWKLLQGLFPVPDDQHKPLDHYLAWLQRAQRCVLENRRWMGQAVFLCGPRNNGKTLLCMRVVRPLLGNRSSNPMDYLTGDTNFNSELFDAFLLTVNDEDAPSNENSRKRMLQKIKGLVVNPSHKFHAKFEKPLSIDWTGRMMVTLNDDPASVGMLMEVDHNTHDKQMYFATQAYQGKFPSQDVIEADLAKELPYFSYWLRYGYKAPEEVLSDDRMGVKSYFDPRILKLSNHQTFASNLLELIAEWQDVDAYWDGKTNEWTGTPTALLSALQICDATAGVAREWTQHKMAKSLTVLAKQDGSGISHLNESEGRDFCIKRLKPMK